MGNASLSPFFANAAVTQALGVSSQSPLASSYVLGDASQDTRRITVGDFVETSQRASFSGTTLVRFRAVVKTRPQTGDVVWVLSLLLDDTSVYSLPLTQDRTLYDLAIPLHGLSGSHRIAARLTATGTAGTYDLLVPAVELFSVAESAGLGLAIANRTPESNQTRIPVNSTIGFDLLNLAGSAPTIADVYVDGVVAYSGGVFANAYTGSAASVHSATGTRFTITPPVLLPSNQIVTVRVVSTVGASVIDESWSFQIEDVTSPVLTEVLATARKTIRVRFSETLVALDASVAGDALNPASWSIEAVVGPERYAGAIVPIAVASVEQTDLFEFTLTTDQDHTMNGSYVLTVAGVSDVAGNMIGSPSTGPFLGFAPEFPAERTMTLLDELPDLNVGADDSRDLARLTGVLQESLDLQFADIDRWNEILDPDLATEPFVDAMLLDLGNPFSFALSLIDKRRLVQLLVAIRGIRGTEPGIKLAIRFFMGIEVTLDYIAYHGLRLGHAHLGVSLTLSTSSPYYRRSFKVIVPRALTDEERERMLAIVMYMKSSRWHLIAIVEPSTPTIIDHWQLGRSRLGVTTLLHL